MGASPDAAPDSAVLPLQTTGGTSIQTFLREVQMSIRPINARPGHASPADLLPDRRGTQGDPAPTPLEVRRSTRDDLMQLTESLAREFSGRVPPGRVIRCVALARERLLAAGVRAGLVVAVESMTRVWLEQPAPMTIGVASSTRGQPALGRSDRGWGR